MISVNFRPDPRQHGGYHPVDNPLLLSGIVNWRMEIHSNYWRPPTDLIEMEDSFIVRVEIAGMRDGEFSVSLEDSILSISGVRNDTGERRSYHQMEIRFGEFSTEVELPNNVDIKKITAEYDDGFLRVVLPKAQPKQINVGDRSATIG